MENYKKTREEFLEEMEKMKSKTKVISRMCNELMELNNKLTKLHRFLEKELDNLTDNEEKYQILEQRQTMCNYAKILGKRIATETELFVKEV